MDWRGFELKLFVLETPQNFIHEFVDFIPQNKLKYLNLNNKERVGEIQDGKNLIIVVFRIGFTILGNQSYGDI